MGTVNQGNQTIIYDYKYPAKGRDFSKSFRGIIKPGIYSGGLITQTGNNTISIGAMTIVIDSGDDKCVKITTSAVINLSVLDTTPVIYAKFDWADRTDNFADFDSRASGSPITNEVIIGELTFGGGIITGISYTNKDVGFFDSDFNIFVDQITEKTSGSGVTIEDINFTDRTISGDNGVTIESFNIKDYKLNGTYYINSQAGFDAITENVTGTQYQFIDDVISVVLDNLSGGYQLPSSGNGYLETNNCLSIEMKGGAFLDANAGIGYLKIDTDDCYLRNVWIQGNGSVGATVQSFILNANRVTYDNCKCSNRNSNVDMVGFQGSSTALHNITSKYINCSAFTLDGIDKIYGFKDCMNISNGLVYDVEGTVDLVHAFDSCISINNCRAYQLDTTSGECYGFSSCSQISNCIASDIDSSLDLGDVSGFYDCDQITSCLVEDIDSAGLTNYTIGFFNCDQITSCTAKNITTVGLGDAAGFQGCNQLSGCKTTGISAGGVSNGFRDCEYGSAIWTDEAANALNNWIDTEDDQITNKVSTPSIWT